MSTPTNPRDILEKVANYGISKTDEGNGLEPYDIISPDKALTLLDHYYLEEALKCVSKNEPNAPIEDDNFSFEIESRNEIRERVRTALTERFGVQ